MWLQNWSGAFSHLLLCALGIDSEAAFIVLLILEGSYFVYGNNFGKIMVAWGSEIAYLLSGVIFGSSWWTQLLITRTSSSYDLPFGASAQFHS